LDVAHPPPLVPRERRFEVRERAGPDGVLVPLDEPSLERAVAAVAASGAGAACVGLLPPYAHPAPQPRRAAAPRPGGAPAPRGGGAEPRECEGRGAACIDASLTPVLGRYLDGLGGRAEAAGLPAPAIMQSNGGVIPIADAARHAAWTVLSGPAAGVIGATWLARRARGGRGRPVDMGGTSCDAAPVQGQPP